MQKKNKILLATAGVLIVGTVAIASQSGMLAGRFGVFGPQLYLYEGKAVSVVTSPVPSVVTSDVSSDVTSLVTSEVTSEGGVSLVTSEVTSSVSSEVPSVVVSPVASGVVVKGPQPGNIGKLQQLTGKILSEYAKKDFKKNPKKYVLTDMQIEKLLDLYEENSK